MEMTEAVITIVIVLFGIGFIRGLISAVWNNHKSANMDKDGVLHCKRCGCTSFAYGEGKYGETIVKCVKCGYSWKT